MSTDDYYASYEVLDGRKRATKRAVYHVVYNAARKIWLVEREGNKRPSAKDKRKAEAVEKAKDLAKRAKLGQVIIHKRNGQFQTEYTYGEDPAESKG